MRYVLQILAMLTDIIIIGASVIAICTAPASLITWALVAITFKVWHEQSGFMAWKKENIKRFLSEAKKIGL